MLDEKCGIAQNEDNIVLDAFAVIFLQDLFRLVHLVFYFTLAVFRGLDYVYTSVSLQYNNLHPFRISRNLEVEI